VQWMVELGAGRTGTFGQALVRAGLFAAVLLAGSCGSSTPTSPEGGAKPLALRDFIDSPTPRQTVAGKFVAFGWAVSKDGIKRISASIARRIPIDCSYGSSRPDVNQLVPGFPSGDNPGWGCPINASTLPAGNHEIAFESENGKGEIRSLGIVPVIVAH
jgi:hypothetical protein